MTKKDTRTREFAVEVKDLRKSFRIPVEQSSGIKQKIINHLRGIKGYRDFIPLDEISFEIEKGEFFGIVGRNGSGKSTLLKLLAGIYTPDSGNVTVNGSLVPFIELGVGFNPELTGRENVFLNGALLGFSRDDMESMYDDIVEFAELGDFMEERLKNYSSGMQVRLAFSIAIRANGDILLLDEVLAVGDEAFQRKCFSYFAELKRKKKTVILVTHDMGAVRKFCTKAMMIKKGEIVALGNPEDIASLYTEENFETNTTQHGGADESKYLPGLNDLVPEFEMTTESSGVVKGDYFVFDISFELSKSIEVFPSFSFTCEGMGKSIFDEHKPNRTVSGKGKHTYRYEIPVSNLNNADYIVVAILRDAKTEDQIAYVPTDRAIRFKINRPYSGRRDNGLLNAKGKYVEIDGEEM